MLTEGEGSGRRTDRKLDDIVRDANEYYSYLRTKDVGETRLHVAVVSFVVWVSVFAALGFSSLAIYGRVHPQTLLLSAGIAIVIGVASGLVTYVVRHRRRFRFAELGDLLNRMKEGGISSEDGLHLVDAVHQARLVAKKTRIDSAFEYGLIAFILVGLIGQNAAVGLLAGVIVYLYFRFEALREYERAEERYENSKNELLSSL